MENIVVPSILKFDSAVVTAVGSENARYAKISELKWMLLDFAAEVTAWFQWVTAYLHAVFDE